VCTGMTVTQMGT